MAARFRHSFAGGFESRCVIAPVHYAWRVPGNRLTIRNHAFVFIAVIAIAQPPPQRSPGFRRCAALRGLQKPVM
jgi:hypothetical protein